jgi:hypothetical protein
MLLVLVELAPVFYLSRQLLFSSLPPPLALSSSSARFPHPLEHCHQMVAHQQLPLGPDLVNRAREHLKDRSKEPVQELLFVAETSELTGTNFVVSHNGLIDLIHEMMNHAKESKRWCVTRLNLEDLEIVSLRIC